MSLDGAEAPAPSLSSPLYREPRSYDFVFLDTEETTAAMVRTAIHRYRPGTSRSILDVGLAIDDVLNARAYLEGDGFEHRAEGRVDTPHFQAALEFRPTDLSGRIRAAPHVDGLGGRNLDVFGRKLDGRRSVKA